VRQGIAQRPRIGRRGRRPAPNIQNQPALPAQGDPLVTDEPVEPPRRRGRPRLNAEDQVAPGAETRRRRNRVNAGQLAEEAVQPVRRGRGRPRLNRVNAVEQAVQVAEPNQIIQNPDIVPQPAAQENSNDEAENLPRNPVEELTNTCSVCLISPKTRIFIPCGHLFCQACASQLRQNDNRCYLCRQNVLQVFTAYL
jgi:hypothetical protein